MLLFRRCWKDLDDKEPGLLTELSERNPALGETYRRCEELLEWRTGQCFARR